MISHIINNWSVYQLITMFFMFLLIVGVVVLTVWYITKNKKFVFFSGASILSSLILTFIGLLLTNILFKITISYIFLLTPVLILTTNLIHIGMSVGFFSIKKMQKYPNMKELKKEFLKDSLQISIFIILLFTSFLLFLDGISFSFLLLSGILTVLITWINMILAKVFFKDE